MIIAFCHTHIGASASNIFAAKSTTDHDRSALRKNKASAERVIAVTCSATCAGFLAENPERRISCEVAQAKLEQLMATQAPQGDKKLAERGWRRQ